MKVDYFAIIQKYFDPQSDAYKLYVPHVVLVTQLALKIGRRLELSSESLQFIEEACMLHDLGIIKVDAKDIGCHGTAPYIQHGILGKEMLDMEALPQHALVCERHTGVGLTKEDITSQHLPLPEQDFIPVSTEEKIICYADIWFSKNPEKLWRTNTVEQIHHAFQKFPKSEEKLAIFEQWRSEFGE